ncbi:hypothetical protein M501DRAFT_976223 [Patellaria atrata CBS 101060]|uniref:Heterokaryon incompatibility domain-containing protein n=1 Tax=Patellaria atrata CBS 101060 TaxID=1346257 RepID=A0A9P4SAN1_9PEZI|nr:hypothetical protein M501DRAFT_976223 [Patellaria atrata CBS 101060]
MAKIYGNAHRIHVWLGEEDKGSSHAMNFITKLVKDLTAFDSLIRQKDDEAARNWDALAALMKRDWFTRKWVIQEITLAKRAELLCGDKRVTWRDFADAVSLFNEVETGTRSLSRIMKSREDFGNVSDFFGHVPAFSATRLVEATNELFTPSKDGQKKPLRSLEYLVSTLSSFNATEPRDTIYGLLAIAKDTSPRTAKPLDDKELADLPPDIRHRLKLWGRSTIRTEFYNVDYKQSTVQVFKEFIMFAISKADRTRALDVICRPWAPRVKGREDKTEAYVGARAKEETDPDLPSWIPQVTNRPFDLDGKKQRMERKNADALCGMPGQNKNYTAAGSRTVTKRLKFEDGETHHSNSIKDGEPYYSMFVEGFELDVVADLQWPSLNGVIPREWRLLGKWKDYESAPPDEFWRTLVGDRGQFSRNTMNFYPRTCLHAMQQCVPDDNIDTNLIINDNVCSITCEFLRRVQAVVWNRCLMRSKETKQLGLVPKYSKNNDLICILYGCSVPVILRRYEKTDGQIENEREQREERNRAKIQDAAIKIQRAFRGRKKRNRSLRPPFSIKYFSIDSAPAEMTRGLTPAGTASSGTLTSTTPGQTIPEGNQRSDERYYYEFVGEAYVHGMMNGEAIDYFASAGLKSQLFELR